MPSPLIALVIVVVLAVVFDFINGFHDTANAIATVVATRVMTPIQAILMAGFLNFLGAISGTAVAKTVGAGLVDPKLATEVAVAAALIGAIIWNLVTWYYGIPSSSSHALIGGLVGAALAKVGAGSLVTGGLVKIVAFIFIAPLLGMALGMLLMIVVSWLFVRSTPRRIDAWFRRLQLVSAGL